MEEHIEPNKVIETVLKADEIIAPLVDDSLITLAMSLGINQAVFKDIYQVIRKRGEVFSHQVMMGPLVKADFDWVTGNVDLQVGPYRKSLIFNQLLRLMGLIDSVYSPVHPLGTVLKLNREMLPDKWQEMVSDQEEVLVMVTGRKQDLPGVYANYLFDYITVIWPLGALPEVEPIGVSNMMIENVVSPGYTNELEKEMEEKILKASQLANQQVSSAFMPDEVAREYLAEIVELSQQSEGE
ncbi:hypothetical protein WOSG25_012560 [Weissella oryzae SG25]|uniref:DUF4176 domain-containing protein n=1 Tax=Weissella oryzae (strain DSM 25784 / JCM 18191 / LMG 30913 / SG25) TaxID=1329250 RepID=A0A069CRX2_WEIOS|nr:DUF4176 domain-containing protein [Weissella oryzae]GAK30159.1 hypothetical protein WOSG25_012560 [Weissella oryzae SG25]